MADGKEQMAKSRWQRADGKEQMAKSRWQRADGKEQMVISAGALRLSRERSRRMPAFTGYSFKVELFSRTPFFSG
jgi:hypothetical protein